MRTCIEIFEQKLTADRKEELVMYAKRSLSLKRFIITRTPYCHHYAVNNNHRSTRTCVDGSTLIGMLTDFGSFRDSSGITFI